ncbi:MAG: endolytic transglycosylase MltG [Proteobacteria bacterium]|nr:endolytic transglycosylase MltG [Pseudomonadota bacterium]
MKRALTLAAVGALSLLVLAGAAALQWQRALAAPTPESPETVDFVVTPGASLGRVARELESAGLVRRAWALEWLARLRGVAGRLQTGEYELSAAWPADEVLERITSGRVKSYEVVIPEGLRASEITARLVEVGLVDGAAFERAVNDADWVAQLGLEGSSLEGYLYPETYRLPRGLSAQAVAETMVDEFRGAWAEVAPLAREQGRTMLEVVTLASIVEKETGVPEERPLIAAVFLNRLRRGMRLETDPSVIYGIANFDGNLKKKHLRDSSNPYNTYRHGGLPPGPIASPGRDALRAVVEPAKTDYLYFVSRGDGTHKFSKTYREHVNAVNRYQKRRRRP